VLAVVAFYLVEYPYVKILALLKLLLERSGF